MENRNLLIHFLNAILTSDLTAPITEAEILNPYKDKEFLDDKLSMVDVTKPKDSEGRLYRIEIQLLTYRHNRNGWFILISLRHAPRGVKKLWLKLFK